MKIDKSKPVALTGATGYVAGWLVKKLLEEGLTVHAPVRDPSNMEKLNYLNQLAKGGKGNIKYFKADLLQDGSYDEALQGCELVFHTASPFINKVKDPQSELLDPALNGTRNVLSSVNKTTTVKRVVLTSSVASVFGDTKDLLSLPNKTATEEHWNETSSLNHMPYNYSKVMAEKEAWKINKEQERWQLVVINPSFVLGPGISPQNTSESYNVMKQMGDGTFKMGVPAFSFGMIDVRDLAVAHYNAGFIPEAQGRYIISAERRNFLEMANMLRDKFGTDYPFPKGELPKWLIWVMAPLVGISRSMVSKNIGYPFSVDNTKGKLELGMHYRPIKESIVDFFQQLVDNGVFKK